MNLKYTLSGALSDPWVYLKGGGRAVQDRLDNYNGKLLGLSITPDGNRRCARRFGMPSPVDGHREGITRIEDMITHLRSKRIKMVDEVLFWGLSRVNKERPSKELEGLYTLLREFKPRLLKLSIERQIHTFMVGDSSLLPADIGEIMGEISHETQQFNSVFRCALALGYDMEGEIARQSDVLRNDGIDGDSREIREKAFEKAHNGLREPDTMIRAGSDGRHRTSGCFMGPNTAQHFFRAYWPTITTRHIDFALHSTILQEINNGK